MLIFYEYVFYIPIVLSLSIATFHSFYPGMLISPTVFEVFLKLIMLEKHWNKCFGSYMITKYSEIHFLKAKWARKTMKLNFWKASKLEIQ